MKGPIFLTLVEIVEIHHNQVELYGGEHGVRDIRLLESAIAQPEASFAGEWLHTDIFEMASAYAFHICMNHPFVDGNKRAALVAALAFLGMNDIMLSDPKERLKSAMLEMAASHMGKKEFAEILRNLPVS